MDAQGLVRLRGAITGGTNNQFATLPIGVRPSKIVQAPVYAACEGIAPHDATDDSEGLYIEQASALGSPGGMSFSSKDCGIYSLDGVTFQP